MNARPFKLTASPLPTGVTLLEASAGTGKTYTIAGLVTRYVAEGVRLPRLLVVTFTRAATAELRDRVRRRLVEAAAHLEAVEAGAAPDGSPGAPADDLLRLLAAGSDGERRQRRRNLEAALADFDAATVATIHGFCQQVLGGIGLAGDVDRAATLIEDQRDIVEAVVDDLMVRTYHDHRAAELTVTRNSLADIARAVVDNAGATIIPLASDVPTAALRVDLAGQVRAEVERRKRALGVLSYDDVLTRLAAALRDRQHGDIARRRLRAKYDVALIDEFQDTDPVQWDIVSDAFGGEGRTLVLIGDPKQAIYAFRGADVHAYLAAARTAGTPATLRTNWRSDGPLLDAYNVLFDGATLGHADIPYRAVGPAPGHRLPRLRGAPDTTPLRIKVVRRDAGVRLQNKGKEIVAAAAREHVARDLAVEIVRLLDSDAVLVQRAADGEETGAPAAVEPGHLAVLVRTNAEATLVQRTLRDVAVPAVINGVGSVFATVGATDWLRLLEALERPGSRTRAAAVALTPFVDWTARQVAECDDDGWDDLHELLHGWAALLRGRGVASLARAVSDQQRLPARLLGRVGGERLLTDLDHVAELLHAAAAVDQLGIAALAAWLRRQLAEADEDVNPEERARRLESDADAVQVLTVHRSKGLEFPIVFAPYLWSCNTQRIPVPVLHTTEGRVVDVGGPTGGEEHRNRQTDAAKERRGEDIRLLYVALTRARHQAVVWWAPTTNGKESPLGRMLFCRSSRGVRTDASCALPSDDDALDRIGQIVARSDGTIGVEASPAHDHLPSWSGAVPVTQGLGVAPFNRELDHRWRRASYSSLTRNAHDAAYDVAHAPHAPHALEPSRAEPEERVTDDEALITPHGAHDTYDTHDTHQGDAPADRTQLAAQLVPLHALRGGADTGTFVHGVLEQTDFAAPDLDGQLREAVQRQAQRHGVPQAVLDGSDIAAGLRLAIETPLGRLAGGLSLRDIGRADRLDELGFELPLAADPQAAGSFSVAALGRLLRVHLPAEDPLAGYADSLGDAAFHQAVRGYLNGSIDVVLRLPGDGAARRYLIADYKTNVLVPRGQPLTTWSYRPAALVDAMRRGHYPLQALLYAVALHRYLRWRIAGYDPDSQLGGVLYLFVRGMTGRQTPMVEGGPCGVFAWRPPTSLVLALSDLLDAGDVAA